MFVHGFNNDFDDAAFTLAEMWHYLGREQVPLLYTWPAGRGGPSGYIYDRESGEFTVYHLKRLIRALDHNLKLYEGNFGPIEEASEPPGAVEIN